MQTQQGWLEGRLGQLLELLIYLLRVWQGECASVGGDTFTCGDVLLVELSSVVDVEEGEATV